MIPRVLGAVLALAALGAVVWASNVPMPVNGSGGALLRLAWGARPERRETCREPSPEELSRLPQHMRQARICEGIAAEYRLVVTAADGRVLVDRVIRGGGLRQDRRLYVFEELPIAAGPAAFDVRFERISPSSRPESGGHGDDDEAEEDDDHAGRHAPIAPDRLGAVPASLSLAVRATARAREVILVTYDAQRRQLIIAGPTGPHGS